MAVQSLAIFTICSNNYVPMAKVLMESVHRHHPNARMYLCLADRPVSEPDFYPAACEVVPAAELQIPEFTKLAFRYDVMEFNTAVKPSMIRHLLGRGHDAVLYFDPDIELFAPLDSIVRKLDEGASFLLTPHLLRPAEGDSDPDDVGIMRAGIYNLGFLGVGATVEVPAILDWWARRLRYQCVSDQANGLFVDQKFVDLVPGFADKVAILRDPCYNVAYWNLAQRQLTNSADGWLVDGSGLGFFHFSGFDPKNQDRLSKYTSAFQGDAIVPALRALMQHYASRVMANGYRHALEIPYAYGTFASGARIEAVMRREFRARHEHEPGDPFARLEAEALRPDAEPASSEELVRRIEDIHASTSWRVTRPLRAVKQLLSR